MKNWRQNQRSTLRSLLLAVELTALVGALLWLARTEWVMGKISNSGNELALTLVAVIAALVILIAWGYWKLHADHMRLGEAERVLRESEQRYRALFHNRHAMMLIVDPHSGKITDANPVALKFYGYNYQQITRMNISQLTDKPEELLADPQANPDPAEQQPSYRSVHRLANGEQRQVEIYSGPILYGDREYLYLIVHDVTDRHEIEEALRLSESTLQSVFRAAPNGIGMVRERVLVWVNQEVCAMTGYSQQELVGQSARLLYESEDEFKRVGDEKYAQIHKTGKGTVETRWKRKDGSLIDILLSSTAIDPANLLAGVIFTATDVSQLKRADDELQQSEERYRQLFSTMQSGFAVHEIILDEDGKPCDYRYLDVNPAFEKLTGLKPEQVLGKTVLEVLPQIETEWIETYGQVALTGEPASFERFTGTLGRYFDVYAYSPERGKFAAIFMDVSERVRYQQKQDTLISISRQLRSAGTRQELAARILSGITQSLFTDGAALGSYSSTSQDVNIELGNGSMARLAGLTMPGMRPILDKAMAKGTALQISDIHADPDARIYAAPGDPPFLALAPLLAQSGPLGALMVNRQTAFSDVELQTLDGIAEFAAIALQRVTLDEMTRSRLQRLEALHKIDQTINSGLELSITLGVMLEVLLVQLGVDAAAVLQLNPHSHLLEYAAGRGFKITQMALLRANIGKGLANNVIIDRALVQARDLRLLESDPRRAAWQAEEGFVAYIGAPIVAKGEIKGVLEVYHRSSLAPDAEWLSFLDTLAGQFALAIEGYSMYSNLQRSHLELALAYDTTLEGWAKTLELRDHETEGHSRRVTEMTIRLARALGVSEQDLVDIRRGALLHDLGKVGIPDQILHKAGPLSSEEWNIMHQHPVYAYDLLSTIPYLRRASEIPYCHHEKWDGSGYPRGLQGEQIPLSGRIFAVVDVWDALLSERPYRTAWSQEKVKEYIQEESGRHFDPHIVRAFLAILDGGNLFDERTQTRLE